MSDIRKKYRKYWITRPKDDACKGCDAILEDCNFICVPENCSKEVNNKLPIFKLIKKD